MGKKLGTIKKGSILLTEWINEAKIEGKIMELPNITITRCYMGKDKVWRYGSQFRPSDMPDILKAINEYSSKA